MGAFDFWNKTKLQSNNETEDKIVNNSITLENNDGAVEVTAQTFESSYAINFSYDNEAELINIYRETAAISEVDFAVEDIVNEAINSDDDETPIRVDLEAIEGISDGVKTKIQDEWEHVAYLLDLDNTAYDHFKQWYVDGRAAYQKVVNPSRVKDGLIDVIKLDSLKVRKVREVNYDEANGTIRGVNDYFLYDESANTKEKTKKDASKSSRQKVLKLDPKMIAYVTSGMTDSMSGFAISNLHKSVKAANQLRAMENSLVVYRITRAPERRIFYVDTSSLTPTKAQQHLKALQSSYRNKVSFDPDSGQVKDKKHMMTMQEDYWLPRNSQGKGTEITTLPGGQNLGDIEDIEYFLARLYKSLNVPVSRLDSGSVMNVGKQSEITRDELKFNKFIGRLRKQFNQLFLDLIKTQLILKNIITEKDWPKIEKGIQFIYAQDFYINEQKENEVLLDRLEILESIGPYVGKYISHKTVRTKVLKQTSEDMEEEDKEIQDEVNNEQYNPPEPEEGEF